MRDLTTEEKRFFREKHRCPFCGSTSSIAGPAGVSQNLYCTNQEECGAGFNVAVGLPFSPQLISASKIPEPDWYMNQPHIDDRWVGLALLALWDIGIVVVLALDWVNLATALVGWLSGMIAYQWWLVKCTKGG